VFQILIPTVAVSRQRHSCSYDVNGFSLSAIVHLQQIAAASGRDVTAAPTLAVFRKRLKTYHFLPNCYSFSSFTVFYYTVYSALAVLYSKPI